MSNTFCVLCPEHDMIVSNATDLPLRDLDFGSGGLEDISTNILWVLCSWRGSILRCYPASGRRRI